jgi:hypothetical protein
VSEDAVEELALCPAHEVAPRALRSIIAGHCAGRRLRHVARLIGVDAIELSRWRRGWPVHCRTAERIQKWALDNPRSRPPHLRLVEGTAQ